MKVNFKVKKHILQFTFRAGTSRGSFTEKPTWFIEASTPDLDYRGIGEASPLKGLSIDFSENFETELHGILNILEEADFAVSPDEILIQVAELIPAQLPSIRFGVETALFDLVSGGKKKIFTGPFYKGKYRIPINGLIWMGDEAFMQKQIKEKLAAGFSTIKMKIGAIDFETEFNLLESIRERYSEEEITLRVDANGAFQAMNAEEVLTRLASLQIHSIEQPIAKGQRDLMKELAASEILPIALDEELIGVTESMEKLALLDHIKPQFIILKPSLLGGIAQTIDWINIAESLNIGWWMTSMLESNIGLNAIAQLTAQFKPELPQGLGTGQLYHNNIDSPLEIRSGELLYNSPLGWADPM